MLERLEMTDGLGAIYPAMLNAIIALRCLGYSEDDPQVIRARDEFEKLGIEQAASDDLPEPTFRMQPCVSPVWDTAQAVYVLSEAGVPRNDPRLIKAADWMLSKEVRHKGDWSVKFPALSPAAGTSSSTTSFTPTRTILPRYCLRLTALTTRASAISTRLPSGPLTGCWPCNAAMADGAASTKTTPR